MSVLDLRVNLTKSYDKGAVERAVIPESKIDWNVPYPEYSPPTYTLPCILQNTVPWADPNLTDKDFSSIWNNYDDSVKIDRRSHNGIYQVSPLLGPLNPAGRTGLQGRGRLGRWGPNHACDPIVTRWKKDKKGRVIRTDSGLPCLQFIAIQRKDTLDWAIPGGMIDPGESYNSALLREFMEEVFNSEELPEEDANELKVLLDYAFKNGEDVYAGYVDDPRNTDNAWMETRAVNFHLYEDSVFSKVTLKAGSDALNAKWIDVNSTLHLYASHRKFIQMVAQKWKASW